MTRTRDDLTSSCNAIMTYNEFVADCRGDLLANWKLIGEITFPRSETEILRIDAAFKRLSQTRSSLPSAAKDHKRIQFVASPVSLSYSAQLSRTKQLARMPRWKKSRVTACPQETVDWRIASNSTSRNHPFPCTMPP